MLNSLIKFSLRHRLTVIVFAVFVIIYGGWIAFKLPIDVFPDLNRPIVTVLTDSHGLAPEEVETLITLPIETALNGTPDVVRIRSSSAIGISIVYVEFEWGTDIFRNRQLVAERLQLAKDRLPPNITPVMTPTSSIMGEIMFVGVTSHDGKMSPMDLRSLADWTIRPRLMTVSDISQVIVMGGDLKQYQILVSGEKLQKMGIALEDLKHALTEISENTTGGFLDIGGKEFLIRPLGRVQSIEDISNSYVGLHLGRPVLLKEVAEIKIGSAVKRGNGSVNGKRAVILTIQKQPSGNTIELTKDIEQELKALEKSLPDGVKIETDLFKQSRFIENSVSNVEEALRDGAIMVAIILFLFLLNIRTTIITLTAIPLSFVITAIVFKYFGLSVNTMTLGGLAVAIGELVDDAIVDVENVYRRLRENKLKTIPLHPMTVIYRASSEVRNSIVFSTIIVVLVFVPLFALDGIEGRLFAPLGIAYIISLLASLLVSLTVTPALCSYLLPNSKAMEHAQDGRMVRALKNFVEKIIRKNLGHHRLILGGATILVIAALALLPLMGRNFLPDFNEGSATIGISSAPGISLDASDEIGMNLEKAFLTVPEVKNTVRRVGRAEMDEHAEGVHWNEIDVDFKEGGRSREIVLADIRKKIETTAPEVFMNIGQPISHRLDHLFSGVRAQIAIKVFGPDLSILRRLGGEIFEEIKDIKGVVDLSLEPLVLIPQVKMNINREASANARMGAGALARDLEAMLSGEVVGQSLESQKIYNIYLRLDSGSRKDPESIKNIPIKVMPTGNLVRVQDVADVYQGTGPNAVNREDMIRRFIVSANSQGRDLGNLVEEIQSKIDKLDLPKGYFIKIGGQFESQQKASQLLLILGLISLMGIFFVLYVHFHSVVLTLQVMLNVPLSLIGSIVAIYLTERILSVATLVAFITLCGIASRNGIMMITHYLHLIKEEGEEFSDDMIVRGSLERLVPVLMTALSAALALVPLLMSKGEAGKEILHPVAVVIVGGLISSTLLDIIVTPVIFKRFGKKASEKWLAAQTESDHLFEGELK
jgi:CzcA family heavy metal efflux pump